LLVAIALAWRVGERGASERKSSSAREREAMPPGFFREIVPVAPWVFAFPSIAFAVLPPLVKDRLGGLAIAYVGLITAMTLLAGVLVQAPLRRIAPRRAASIGLSVGAVGLLFGFYVASRGWPGALLFAAMLLGAAYGATFISGLRWVEGATTATTRGRVMGIFYVFTYVGFAAPFVLSTLARRSGDTVGLLLTAGLAIATAAYTSLRHWRSESTDAK
jgi:MFS family permease